MKRLLPIIAALTVLAGPLAMGGEAWAGDQHGGRGEHGGDRGGDRGGRGADRGGDRGGERGGDRGGRGGDRGRDQGDRGGQDRRRGDDGAYRGRGGPPQGWRDGRGEPDRSDRRSYESYGPAPYAPSARRGGYMPPRAGGAIPDYGRYRLRPPPRGYVWVRTGNGYAMVSEDTGRVFDVVPY